MLPLFSINVHLILHFQLSVLYSLGKEHLPSIPVCSIVYAGLYWSESERTSDATCVFVQSVPGQTQQRVSLHQFVQLLYDPMFLPAPEDCWHICTLHYRHRYETPGSKPKPHQAIVCSVPNHLHGVVQVYYVWVSPVSRPSWTPASCYSKVPHVFCLIYSSLLFKPLVLLLFCHSAATAEL